MPLIQRDRKDHMKLRYNVVSLQLKEGLSSVLIDFGCQVSLAKESLINIKYQEKQVA
jgi:hypothetical protein